ncbi:MAG: hypothetical protein CFE45_25300 [Burkholderiales bacterium PBB5]|nr:MAG: hypothetical protein CFE45_25300 [Burkholderiales bacterium PBB5]
MACGCHASCRCQCSSQGARAMPSPTAPRRRRWPPASPAATTAARCDGLKANPTTPETTSVVLVTHGWHMRRSLRAFEQEAVRQGAHLQIQPSPMGMPARSEAVTALHWLPSPEGYRRVHQALREYIGLLAGA